MTVNLVIGSQWGDEVKGKVVDYYSKDADFVVRFQGGNNAGHTIKVGDEVYKLHITPSGVIQGKTGVIGNGVVIDPEILIKEIDELTNRGLKPKLLISDRANFIMPYHKILDGAEEKYLGDKKIGTTKRGIGPCYADKIARNGIRGIDLLNKITLSKKLDNILPIKQRIFKAYEIKEKLDKNRILNDVTYLKKCPKILCTQSKCICIDNNTNKQISGPQYICGMLTFRKEVFDRIDCGGHIYFCGLKKMMPGIIDTFKVSQVLCL